jgi:hypothetical protein
MPTLVLTCVVAAAHSLYFQSFCRRQFTEINIADFRACKASCSLLLFRPPDVPFPLAAQNLAERQARELGAASNAHPATVWLSVDQQSFKGFQ